MCYVTTYRLAKYNYIQNPLFLQKKNRCLTTTTTTILNVSLDVFGFAISTFFYFRIRLFQHQFKSSPELRFCFFFLLFPSPLKWQAFIHPFIHFQKPQSRSMWLEYTKFSVVFMFSKFDSLHIYLQIIIPP